MKLLFDSGRRWPRAVAGLVATGTLAAGAVMGWVESRQPVPAVRLHAGAAWVASNEVGQLTLLDGASAEVMAGVQVGGLGSDLSVAQQGATGYAVDRDRGAVVRIDGATHETSRPLRVGDGGELAVFPTGHALYTMDVRRGVLTIADPKTLAREGKPHRLAIEAAPGDAVVDAGGRLWVLDQRTGDLVWFAAGTRHARAGAHTPGSSALVAIGDRVAVVDVARSGIDLIDPGTGGVEWSLEVDLRAGDSVAVSGSPHRLLISVPSRGLFLSCTGHSCSRPVEVADGAADLGQAVAAGNHALVPDYATGAVTVVDLAESRVVARRQLFEEPVRFDLLVRDGVVFYNDPDSAQAGVVDLDGTVRPITKYEPGQTRDGSPATEDDPEDNAEDNPADNPADDRNPGPPSWNSLTISVRPHDRGVVGEEFAFTAVTGGAGIGSARWTFGDGTRATGVTVRHRWDRPGTYPVRITARLRHGQVVRAAARIVVEAANAPPRILRLDVAPDAPRAGQEVRFSAVLAGGAPRRTAWTVTGDGGTAVTSEEPEFTHVFTAPGTYTVRLVVRVGAATAERSRQFTVAPALREVGCGDTVTTDAVVTRDLVCTGVALTIAADDVVLDLGGHTVSTNGPTPEGKGIVIGAGRTLRNVTVQHGSVSRYPTGIAMTDVVDVTVANVAVSAGLVDTGVWGIHGDHAVDVRLRGVTVNTFHPFDFQHGSSVSITGSIISGDQARGVARCGGDSSCVIESGSLHVSVLGCYDGVTEATSSAVSIRSDDLSVVNLGSSCDTVTVRDSDVNLLEEMTAEQSYLSGNVVTQERGIVFWESFDVIGNTFSGGASSGLHVMAGGGVVSGNTFTGNRGNGVLVRPASDEAPVGPLEISGNRFEGNGIGRDEWTGLDGIRVESAAPGSVIRVTGNQTRYNARYGINAEPGLVVDGGGNRSSGDPLGCRGVVCGRG